MSRSLCPERGLGVTSVEPSYIHVYCTSLSTILIAQKVRERKPKRGVWLGCRSWGRLSLVSYISCAYRRRDEERERVNPGASDREKEKEREREGFCA